jgi:hypothetical protein
MVFPGGLILRAVIFGLVKFLQQFGNPVGHTPVGRIVALQPGADAVAHNVKIETVFQIFVAFGHAWPTRSRFVLFPAS